MAARAKRQIREHVHTPVWVSSSTMPGYLVLRCACGDSFGTKPLTRRRPS